MEYVIHILCYQTGLQIIAHELSTYNASGGWLSIVDREKVTPINPMPMGVEIRS